MAVGDFNGDGKPDLAVTNANSSISVLLGNGDGTFQAAVNYGVGSGSSSVAVGDFNGDGKLDLAVANGNSSISVLLGNGDGTFQAAVNYGVGSGSSSVAVGDFNGDGKLDLAVANWNGSTISVLLGNGDGTFQAAVNYSVGSNPRTVAVGDFNGDGKPDLAVANTSSNTVSVLLGNGDGTFQAVVNYGVGSGPSSVAVGDFNGDGKPDLAVADGNLFTVSVLSVLLGNGDGTFQAAVNYGVGSGPISVAVGDFNGDGKPDLAVANQGSNNVTILLNITPTAAKATSSTTLTSSMNPSSFGQPVIFTATVSSAAGGSPTGTVTFYNGANSLGTAVLNATGQALFSTTTLTLGQHSITAVYGGDSEFSGNTSAVLTQTVNNALIATIMTLASSLNPSTVAQSVTFTATITVTSGTGTPTGTVTFTDGATTLGTGTLNVSGQASYTTSSLAQGTHSITAQYGGDSTYASSTSAALLQVVNAYIPVTLTVTSLADDNTAGTLRSQIGNAHSGDTITFSVTGTITLTQGQIEINTNLAINGPGTTSLAISGGHSYSIFQIDSGATVTIANLTMQDGLGGANGGLISNSGSLTVNNSTLLMSTPSNGDGGGIYNTGTLTVTGSNFVGNPNYGVAGDGGGIFNGGIAAVANSTFSSLFVGGFGGGIANALRSVLTVTNSTFSQNEANAGGALFNNGSCCNAAGNGERSYYSAHFGATPPTRVQVYTTSMQAPGSRTPF